MVSIVKKALLIGINYLGTANELAGCINDTLNLREFLIANKYFAANDFIMMNDNATGLLTPTRAHIEAQLNALVTFADANKNSMVELLIAYSGHGSTQINLNGDEELEGEDQCLCPSDFATAGFIVDDYLNTFINRLHTKVSVVFLIDACHSGTMLDLRYNYVIDAKNTCRINTSENATRCNLVMISGCRDEQTSADAYLPDAVTKKYESQGAMTAAFLACHSDTISYITLINNMRTWLASKNYTQVPQLSSGRAISTRGRFLLTTFD